MNTETPLRAGLRACSLWNCDTVSQRDVLSLLDTASALKRAAEQGAACRLLQGRNLALLCDDDADPERLLFGRAAGELGARVARIRPGALQLADPDELKEAARLLGLLYDAVDCEDMDVETVQDIERHACVPVHNGLADSDHPTRVMSDLMTMREFSGKPLSDIRLCYIGDPRTARGDAWLQLSALMAMQFSIATHGSCWPSSDRLRRAYALAQRSGGALHLYDSVDEAVTDADFICDERSVHVRLDDGAVMLASDSHSDKSFDRQCRANRPYTLQARLLATIV